MTDSSRPDWKTTIRLPQTPFAMKADLATREQGTVERWRSEGLYRRMVANRRGKPVFVMHDGPPYANGDIHHGHALNKILKDFVVKYRSLAGWQVSYVPGWDCHGLPIELKVDEQLGSKKREMSASEFRSHCRAYAEKYINIQSESFQRLLIVGDFEHPYKTMDAGYEATIVREIGRFMEQGYVYRGLKPVHWSWAAVTALAEAEVEYAPYTAPSVYVAFEMPQAPEWLAAKAGGRRVSVVIWTTTPWTLPSNVAIALNPEFDYVLLALDETRAIVVADGLRETTLAKCGLGELDELHRFKGSELVGTSPEDWPRLAARHPFVDRDSMLVAASYVTLDQGTGCVHTAPGHGADDFETGQKYGLPTIAPVNKFGKYTAEVSDYEGQHVFEANPKIAQRLADSGHLLNKPGDTYLVERYPHCWRTKKPLIFRATEQWFIRVDHDNLRERALEHIGKTKWVPPWGENRIRGMIEARPDWCISRQRAWGAPIPAFRCNSCGGEVISSAVAYHVADLTEKHGADVWFERSVEELVPAGFVCPKCGAAASQLEKVEDIVDVWFDSGVSWAAVLRDKLGLGEVAHLYLEGSDQHRGWFHTSLLTGVANSGRAPFDTVLTHGFIVDENGMKYSKSNPKYEPLTKLLQVYGADILRVWVAMVDYRADIVLAPGVIEQAGNTYRKIRNTVRYLLGNVADIDLSRPAPDLASLDTVDRWAVGRVAAFVETARKAYEEYDFHGALQAIYDFCNADMSSVYLDVRKDRMYCDAPESASRSASQWVMYEALRALVITAAPIISFTADEAWALLPRRDGDPDNVLLGDFAAPPSEWALSADADVVGALLGVRDRVKEQIEARRPKKKGERLDGQIGSSQEAQVIITAQPDRAAFFARHASTLADLCIVSTVTVNEGSTQDASGVDIAVEPSTLPRCERCWNHRASVGVRADYPDLCARCADVVASSPVVGA